MRYIHSSISCFPKHRHSCLITLSKMSVFDELRPFVNLCQASGFIPFSIEADAFTKKFDRFTFSLKSASALWFLFIFFLHLLYLYIFRDLSTEHYNQLIIDNNIPVTVSIFSLFTVLSTGFQYLVCRCIVLQYRHLQNAVEAVQNVERIFERTVFLEKPKHSMRNRLVIGTTFILLLVSSNIKQEDFRE